MPQSLQPAPTLHREAEHSPQPRIRPSSIPISCGPGCQLQVRDPRVQHPNVSPRAWSLALATAGAGCHLLALGTQDG